MTLVCTKFNHDAKSTDYLNISIEEDTLQYIDPNLIKVISNRSWKSCDFGSKSTRAN